MALDNTEKIDRGIRKAERLIRQQLLTALVNMSAKLLINAELNREYHSLTGNTLTSYAIGVFDCGKLHTIVTIFDVDSLEHATRKKITQGVGWTEKFFDYDTGKRVMVRREDKIPTDEGYGNVTSIEFLRRYKPTKTDGYVLVFTTGTEYAEYLENVRKLNVLTETELVTPQIAINNLKRVPLEPK